MGRLKFYTEQAILDFPDFFPFVSLLLSCALTFAAVKLCDYPSVILTLVLVTVFYFSILIGGLVIWEKFVNR